MKRPTIPTIIAMLILLTGTAIAQTPDFALMLEEIDERTTFSGGDFSAVYTIISETPGEEREVT